MRTAALRFEIRYGPSLSTLRAIQLNNASWYKEQTLGGIMSIDDFSLLVLDNTIQHVDMSATED